MADFVEVNPGEAHNRVRVAVKEVGGIQYPIYFLSDENGTFAYVDQDSGAVGSINQEHMKIHQGDGYTLSARAVIANGGGALEFLGIVPALSFPHFRKITVSSDGGPFDIDFYEGTTVSANGTQLTAQNNNRNSANTANLDIYSGPTVLTDGVSLEPVLVPGTKHQGGLGSEGSNEWILKQGETYMIRVTNNTSGGGNSNFVINMFWYE